MVLSTHTSPPANGISIGSAVLQGSRITVLSNTKADHATSSVAIGLIYAMQHAMRPNTSLSGVTDWHGLKTGVRLATVSSFKLGREIR